MYDKRPVLAVFQKNSLTTTLRSNNLFLGKYGTNLKIDVGQVFAENNLNKAALRIETGILNILNGLGDTISLVAKETGNIL